MRWVECESKKEKKRRLIDDSDKFERFYVMHYLLFQLQQSGLPRNFEYSLRKIHPSACSSL